MREQLSLVAGIFAAIGVWAYVGEFNIGAAIGFYVTAVAVFDLWPVLFWPLSYEKEV